MYLILAIYGTLFHVCNSPLFVEGIHLYVCQSIYSNILWLYIKKYCKSINILSQNVTINIKSCCQLFVITMETRIVLENTQGIMYGKNVAGKKNMGFWLGRTVLFNAHGIMDEKNGTGQ